MIKQVMLNLLANAVKFTPPGGRIVIEAVAEQHHGLVISIRDTGVGIAKADLDRVREPFVQVDSSLSRRHEGTGLGLPLVEIMMRAHGGVFELDSEENKGTTARVVFPPERLIWPDADQPGGIAETDRIDAPETDFGEAASPIPARVSTSVDTTRILVVEDDRDLCDVLQRMLKRSGFATAGASGGREALRVLKTEPIDLVITDMVMPEMDGVELMRVLQKERPGLPIIALSGMDDVMEYRRIAAHLGARVALLKPVSRADLIRAVTDALAGQVSDAGKLVRAKSA